MAKEASLDSLSKMLGEHNFEAGGHRYVVLPTKLREIRAYMEEQLYGYTPQYLATVDELRAKVDHWMQKQLRDAKGNAVSLAMAEEADWTTDDLRRLLEKLAGISG